MSASCTKTYQIIINPATPTGEYAWWKMEELSGDRVDSVQSIALEPLVQGDALEGRDTGLIDFCLQMIAGQSGGPSSATFSTGALAALAPSADGATLCGWFKLAAAAPYPPTTTDFIKFTIAMTANGILEINGSAFSGIQNYIAALTGAGSPQITFGGDDYPAQNEWAFFAMVYDRVNGRAKYYTAMHDDATPVEVLDAVVLTSGDPSYGAVGLQLSNPEGASAPSVTMWVDELGFFNYPLTLAQLQYLFNGGAGRTSPITFPP